MPRTGQGQGEYQIQTQQQQLTPQQVLLVRLTELPVNDLRERIDKELEENPWLQGSMDNAEGAGRSEETGDVGEPQDALSDTQPTSDDFDDVDDGIPRDPNQDSEERRRREPVDDSESFFDHLKEQLGDYALNDHEREVVEYLIGSLGDDGLLRAPLETIADELDIYHNVQTNEEELTHLLTDVVQQMDPAGVGGRDLQECLTIQARRNFRGEVRNQLVTLFQRYWDDFSHTRWQRIQHALKLDDLGLIRLQQRIHRLNPRPGGSIGGDRSDNHAITPDFLVETDENNQIHLTLNEGDLPRLTVSPDAEEELKQMTVVSKNDREAQRYLRLQVDNAKMFIDAIRQRRDTMLRTMRAIIRLQRPFFLDGDETLLRPMRLEDVAQRTGQDISTVSRVANSKFVQTNHGIYPLRWFFTTAATLNGDAVTVRKILKSLRELVDAEDRRHPLSDEKLASMLRDRGYDVARRTVAKYRTQLGIAESRMRRQ